MQNRYLFNCPLCSGSTANYASSGFGAGSAYSCDAFRSAGSNNGVFCPNKALEILSPSQMEKINELRVVSGVAEAGATVKIRIDDHSLLTAVVSDDNTWTISVPFTLDCGLHTIYAICTQFCNASDFENFIIEEIPCTCTCRSHCDCPYHEPEYTIEAPIILYPASGETIDTAAPVITGTASPGFTVNICIEDVICYRAIADSNGSFSRQLPISLDDGSYSVTAVQIDSSGDRSRVAHNDFVVCRRSRLVSNTQRAYI